MGTRTSKAIAFGLSAAGLVAGVRATSGPAFGQQERPGRLVVSVKVADSALKDRPVMVSAIGVGKIVTQYEIQLKDTSGFAFTTLDSLPAGQYDVELKVMAS